MRIPDYISGLLFLLLASVFLYMAYQFPTAMGQSLGPRSFPVIICGGLLVSSLLLTVTSIRSRKSPQQDQDRKTEKISGATKLVMLLFIIAPIFYVLAVDTLGFLITAFCVMMTTTYAVWGGALRVALFSLASILVIDGIFRGLFGIPLETGLLYIPWW